MNMAAISALLAIVIQELPGAITTIGQLVSLGEKFAASIKGEALSDADRASLRTQIEADVAAALIPLDPAQPGDPDYVKPTT